MLQRVAVDARQCNRGSPFVVFLVDVLVQVAVVQQSNKCCCRNHQLGSFSQVVRGIPVGVVESNLFY